ncbi:formyltransferase family protein [Psychroflexus aestuariivivens]|uniref:formyltransferase family protein n=1 Tax=Psychroflexus aestuariivivens TaxID=1795040 RepID=UPI000FDC7732|nr:formyltransferase family protein [Psychroflexus aestuariivivens]
MKNYILITEKSWHKKMFEHLSQRPNEKWVLIDEKSLFNIEYLNKIEADKIFIPHWSYIIPKPIWSKYECVVFHMTDLPFGRGGSPLQNLIVRGYESTKISALKVDEGIDTGDIYCKENLSLLGTASQIFKRSVPIITNMIERIIDHNLEPKQQKGTSVTFKRRKPEDGKMNNIDELEKVYDYIRMLDGEDYPPAFIETDNLRIEFTNAELSENSQIKANVRILKK